MPNAKDMFAKSAADMHRFIFTMSNGLLLGNLWGMPVLMLTTTGRKTGQKRSTMLTTPLREGDNIMLVASYGGDPRHPTWFLNLRDNPDVEVMMDGRRRPMRARVASKAEKDRMWPEITRRYTNYADYQRQTDRDIPIVILEPSAN